eukprot:gene19525-biopygen14880
MLGVANTATAARRVQLPLLPDFGTTAHLAQGSTMPSALVELNLPASGDRTAAYIALSRVRRREDLFILRPFDATKLRRKATKASVDILLRRLRADLRDCDEGSKMCMCCRTMHPRSAFVDATSKSTAQWMGSDRRCLKCLARDKCERNAATSAKRRARKCHGPGCSGAMLPRTAFGRSQRNEDQPWCIKCNSARLDTRTCGGACGKSLPVSDFSNEQLKAFKSQQIAPKCRSCAATSAAPFVAGISAAVQCVHCEPGLLRGALSE